MHILNVQDAWPGAVSDGLTLPCSICGKYTNIDYVVTDEAWRRYAPHEHRLGVICLSCFMGLAGETGLESVVEMQFTYDGMTLILVPTLLVKYKDANLAHIRLANESEERNT